MAYCLQTLNGIGSSCTSNIGGMSVKCYIANKGDIETITMDASDETVESITMKQSKYFYEYDFKKNSAQLNNEWTIDQASGVKFNTATLNLAFSKQETTKRIAIEALIMGELVVVIKDANGFQQILGADEEPVTALSASSDSGKAKTDVNGYSIVLTEETGHFPYECTQDMSALTQPIA